MADEFDNGERRAGHARVGKAAVLIAVLIAALGLWWLMRPDPWVPVAEQQVEQVYFVMRTTNVRAGPDVDSRRLAQLDRAARLSGYIVAGQDGREWVRLSDGRGYVSARNLSSQSRPALDETIGADLFFVAESDIRAEPDAAAEVVGQTPQTALRAIGRTGEWIEVLMPQSGVGYVAADRLMADEGTGDVTGDAVAGAGQYDQNNMASVGDSSCTYSPDGRWVTCGFNAASCAYSSNGRHVACGGLATSCAYSSAGNFVACGGRATSCAYSSDGNSVACGGLATSCAYASSGNDVACGGLAASCAYSTSGNDVACGGRASSCASSVRGNDVACGGDASSCLTSVDGNDVACGARASGCSTALNGRRACGDGQYSGD